MHDKRLSCTYRSRAHRFIASLLGIAFVGIIQGCSDSRELSRQQAKALLNSSGKYPKTVKLELDTIITARTPFRGDMQKIVDTLKMLESKGLGKLTTRDGPNPSYIYYEINLTDAAMAFVTGTVRSGSIGGQVWNKTALVYY
jgi:hypothetical protein